MHLKLRHNGKRTALFGVNDFHTNQRDSTVTVFWPRLSGMKPTEETFEAKTTVIGAVEESTMDLIELAETIEHASTQGNVRVVLSDNYPQLQTALQEISDETRQEITVVR